MWRVKNKNLILRGRGSRVFFFMFCNMVFGFLGFIIEFLGCKNIIVFNGVRKKDGGFGIYVEIDVI